MTRPIRWDVIAEQYDQMIRYATAIRAGTASTESILRRFTKTNAIHRTYQAMIETGRAQKTLFVARYLRDRDLQRERSTRASTLWSPGTAATPSSSSARAATSPPTAATNKNSRCCCLRVLQSALVYVNTLMVQDVLVDDDWSDRMTDVDHRGLTPLFWTHVAPYGEVRLNMARRLSLRDERTTP